MRVPGKDSDGNSDSVQMVKTPPAVWEFWVGQIPLEKEMNAAHSSILAWRIPWTEDPGGLQSMGSLRGRYDWQTNKQACGDECSLAPESRCGYWLAGSPALPLMCAWEPAKDLPVTATLQVVSKYGRPCIVFPWILEVCIKFCSYTVAVEGIYSFSVRLSL